MPNPVCISPLKFYDSLAKQSHRKSYAYGHISPLITKTGWVPAFQFIIPTQLYEDSTGVFSVHICDAKTNESVYAGVSNDINERPDCYVTPSGVIRPLKGWKVYIIDIQAVSIESLSMQVQAPGLNGYSIFSYFDEDMVFIPNTNLINNNAEQISVSESDVSIPSGCRYICISEYYSKKLVISTNSYISLNYGVRTVDGYKVFMHTGKQPIPVTIPEGLYYIKIISDNSGIWTYYSEVFCFDNVTKDCLELEYWNETGNFVVKNGVIAFPSDFHFKLLLKGEIGKPEYNFEEESTKRLGYIYVESQVSKKTYKFNVIVPEYICDALRIVRLCDNKIIRCKDDEYEAITFEMEAEWQTQGDLASVTCEFETDNVVANIGGFVPDKLGGDYNNDYNGDFDKE